MANLKLPIILFHMLLLCCQQQDLNTLEQAKNEILELHHLQRSYHFNKDSVAFANQLSENFISVNRGEISRPSKQETISRYHRYFSSVEFVRWDDLSDPQIRFSEDEKLAYTLVDKLVEVYYQNEQGDTITSETHFAWTTIYKKYGDEWKIDCVTSTEKPR